MATFSTRKDSILLPDVAVDRVEIDALGSRLRVGVTKSTINRITTSFLSSKPFKETYSHAYALRAQRVSEERVVVRVSRSPLIFLLLTSTLRTIYITRYYGIATAAMMNGIGTTTKSNGHATGEKLNVIYAASDELTGTGQP